MASGRERPDAFLRFLFACADRALGRADGMTERAPGTPRRRRRATATRRASRHRRRRTREHRRGAASRGHWLTCGFRRKFFSRCRRQTLGSRINKDTGWSRTRSTGWTDRTTNTSTNPWLFAQNSEELRGRESRKEAGAFVGRCRSSGVFSLPSAWRRAGGRTGGEDGARRLAGMRAKSGRFLRARPSGERTAADSTTFSRTKQSRR